MMVIIAKLIIKAILMNIIKINNKNNCKSFIKNNNKMAFNETNDQQQQQQKKMSDLDLTDKRITYCA